MKYIKTFENKYDDEIRQLLKPAPYKTDMTDLEGAVFKIGDLVKVKDLDDKIFVITQVKKESGSFVDNVFVYDTENIDPDDPDGWGWTKAKELSPITKSEYKKWLIDRHIDKYNL